MARSRGKSVESSDVPKEPLEESETESETMSEPEPEPAIAQKQWNFSEARKANLQKARDKAKLLREQLKIANPSTPKAKKQSKMEKKLEELKTQPTEPKPKPIEESPPIEPEPEPSCVRLRPDDQLAPNVNFVRKGKFLYVVD